MNNPIVKETILENHFATGDYECFCWDKHEQPRDHDAEFTPKYEQLRLIKDEIVLSIASRSLSKEEDKCRIYPNDIIPDNTRGKRGIWKIRVEFQPLD